METIEDIVREMREHYCCTTAPRSCWVMRKADLIGALDRIEAALKRERAQHAAVLRAQIDEVQRCAVYKEALKPVLQAKVDDGDWIAIAGACVDACREAMRIWREGMEACK